MNDRTTKTIGRSHTAALGQPVVEFNRQPRTEIEPSPAALNATAADELRWRNAIEQYRKQAEGNPNHWAVPIIRRYEAAERKKVSVTRPTRETHVIIGDHDPEPRHDWHGNIPVGTADDGTGRWRDL